MMLTGEKGDGEYLPWWGRLRWNIIGGKESPSTSTYVLHVLGSEKSLDSGDCRPRVDRCLTPLVGLLLPS